MQARVNLTVKGGRNKCLSRTCLLLLLILIRTMNFFLDKSPNQKFSVQKKVLTKHFYTSLWETRRKKLMRNHRYAITTTTTAHRRDSNPRETGSMHSKCNIIGHNVICLNIFFYFLFCD